MKRHLLAFLLLCACATPLPPADRADMQAALPTYQAMTLEALHAVDRTSLTPGKAAAYDKALKDKERAAAQKQAAAAKLARAQQRALEKDLRLIHSAYKKGYALPVTNRGYKAGGIGHWLPRWEYSYGWELKAGGNAEREWFRVSGSISYRFDDDPCAPDHYCGPPREHIRWWGYDRAFDGANNLSFSQDGRHVDSCSETSCDVSEHFTIDIPPQRIFDAIQSRQNLELDIRTDRQEGFHGVTINLSTIDMMALVLHINNVRGYYADEIAADPLMREALTREGR